MDNISFEWDDHKNQINIKKHQISFAEAMSVFYDDYAIVFDDPDHSIEEDRFLIIGKTIKEKTCIVSYCIRKRDVIRIISARKATKREREYYEENR